MVPMSYRVKAYGRETSTRRDQVSEGDAINLFVLSRALVCRVLSEVAHLWVCGHFSTA